MSPYSQQCVTRKHVIQSFTWYHTRYFVYRKIPLKPVALSTSSGSINNVASFPTGTLTSSTFALPNDGPTGMTSNLTFLLYFKESKRKLNCFLLFIVRKKAIPGGRVYKTERRIVINQIKNASNNFLLILMFFNFLIFKINSFMKKTFENCLFLFSNVHLVESIRTH